MHLFLHSNLNNRFSLTHKKSREWQSMWLVLVLVFNYIILFWLWNYFNAEWIFCKCTSFAWFTTLWIYRNCATHAKDSTNPYKFELKWSKRKWGINRCLFFCQLDNPLEWVNIIWRQINPFWAHVSQTNYTHTKKRVGISWINRHKTEQINKYNKINNMYYNIEIFDGPYTSRSDIHDTWWTMNASIWIEWFWGWSKSVHCVCVCVW